MDWLLKLPRSAQVVLAGGMLYVVLSFFDWQQHSFGAAGEYGQSLWHGFGIIVALTAIALLGWELARAMNVTVSYDSFDSATLSIAGAFVLCFFTLIVFLGWSEYRTWAAGLATLIAFVIAGAAFARARGEGVELPGIGKLSEIQLKLPFGSTALAVPSTATAETASEPPEEPDLLEDITPGLRSSFAEV